MFKLTRWRLSALGGLLLAGVLAGGVDAGASNVRFSDFTPLDSSAGQTTDEEAPITFGNSSVQQRSAADRSTQLGAGQPNSGAWDMITVNETGAHKGAFLFTPFETGQAGVQRLNVDTGEAATIFFSPAPGDNVSFDPSYCTPWGTYITAEESW